MTAGEALGFVVPTVSGAALAALDAPVAAVALVVLAIELERVPTATQRPAAQPALGGPPNKAAVTIR